MADWQQTIRSFVLEGGVACVLQQVSVDSLHAEKPDRLSLSEQQRAVRFADPSDRACFHAGRKLIRSLILPDTLPPAVELAQDARGKPFCTDPQALAFNLSHTGNWVALGLSGKGPVGVDIEMPDRRVAAQRLSTRVFSAAEQAIVQQEGTAGFLCLWTRKEARVKAEGTGVSVPLSELDTLSEAEADHWQYAPFALAQGPIGCLVTSQPASPVALWRWFPEEERLQSLLFPST
jgi:phosphopantetheinyl transferase